MAVGDYCTEVLTLFAHPTHAGDLEATAGTRLHGEAAALDRSAWVALSALCRDGRVIQARWRAWGCPHLLAACELTALQLEGRPLESLARFSLNELAERLQVPAEKLGRLLVIEDAQRALAASMPATR